MAEKAKTKDTKKKDAKKDDGKKKVEAKASAPKKAPKKAAKPAAKSAPAKPVKQKLRACKIKGCEMKYRAKGYCRRHYKKWRRGEYGKTRYTPCGQNECFRPMAINRHGYCEEHYIQHFVKKVPDAAPAEEGAAEAAPAADAG